MTFKALIIIGAYTLSSSIIGNDAFAAQKTTSSSTANSKRKRRCTQLYQYDPGMMPFDDQYMMDAGYGYEEPNPMMNNMRDGQMITPYDRQSNLSQRRDSSFSSSSNRQSVREDSRTFDRHSRYSQPPNPYMQVSPHVQQQNRRSAMDGRIQGGSRHTYQNSGYGGNGQTFVETDGRPLNVEMELYDGPNNTPTRVKMYSEDGRQRPMNILTNNNGPYGNGGTVSVRNVGSMEFPIRASVSGNSNMGYGYGGPMGDMMMGPYDDRSPRPSTARGETVQGGSLKTFSLPSHVNAAQVTITSDGLPVNAKVELWGTSTQVKQLAEVYNDNGQIRPFAAILDLPGGENTIAVRNTGPLEYPIQCVVEPVNQMGMSGGMGMMGGYGGGGRGMMNPYMGGYGPPGPPGLPPPMPFY